MQDGHRPHDQQVPDVALSHLGCSAAVENQGGLSTHRDHACNLR